MFGSRPEFIAFLNVAVAATNLVKCFSPLLRQALDPQDCCRVAPNPVKTKAESIESEAQPAPC